MIHSTSRASKSCRLLVVFVQESFEVFVVWRGEVSHGVCLGVDGNYLCSAVGRC